MVSNSVCERENERERERERKREWVRERERERERERGTSTERALVRRATTVPYSSCMEIFSHGVIVRLSMYAKASSSELWWGYGSGSG
jgi:hypothetical protein